MPHGQNSVTTELPTTKFQHKPFCAVCAGDDAVLSHRKKHCKPMKLPTKKRIRRTRRLRTAQEPESGEDPRMPRNR